MLKDIDNLESKINYKFSNRDLLVLSLTHASYANENNIKKINTNQRLEFLGDAVLELISSDFLYSKYLDFNEGQLTKTRAKLVCEESLADIAREIELYNYLLIGKGEDRENLKNNNSTMCDTFEALIGAIYKDSNIDKAKDFINRFVFTNENLDKSSNDFKSILQEKANKDNVLLKYEVISELGPDHDKKFIVAAYYGTKKISEGAGKSKKEAEQNAAKIGLSLL